MYKHVMFSTTTSDFCGVIMSLRLTLVVEADVKPLVARGGIPVP